MRSKTLPAAPPRISDRPHSDQRSSFSGRPQQDADEDHRRRRQHDQRDGAPLAGGIVEDAERHAAVLRVDDIEEARDHLDGIHWRDAALHDPLGEAVEPRKPARRARRPWPVDQPFRISWTAAAHGRADGRETRVAADIAGVLPAALALLPGSALHLDRQLVPRPRLDFHLRNDEQRRAVRPRTAAAAVAGRSMPSGRTRASSGAPMRFSLRAVSRLFSTLSLTSMRRSQSAARFRALIADARGRVRRARETAPCGRYRGVPCGPTLLRR